jgi:cell shape-determining protein MreD
MKIFLLLITLAAFLQSAFLPINLVLVLIVARSLVIEDRDNLFIAFFGGLILSFLTQSNLGYYSILFILLVKLASMLRKLPVSFNLIMIFISGALLIGIAGMLSSFFAGQSFTFWPRLTEMILVLPTYLLLRSWEDRFVATSHTKLRIRA